MTSIKDYMVQHNEADNSILHTKLLNVNMRLFNSNKEYRQLILSITAYMKTCAKIDFSDYTSVKGISGANIGIPFNIIGVYEEGYRGEEGWNFFLNPRCLYTSGTKIVVKSKCGSFSLRGPVEVERYSWIKLKYYTTEGKVKTDIFAGSYGYTIQHEVNHNNGITVYD